MTITRLLVANRGEIARRVFRTCRLLGIETVAVHSDPDAALPFVAEADVAVRLPGASPTETYLRGDLIVEAAQRAGADAVHPGYGFLSESADFARRVLEAGLTWVGPAPESIEAMGSKVAAKKLMESAGVPVLGNLDAEAVTEGELPVLVKASAGGGGRGMRVVRSLDELAETVALAESEAASAFGDGTVFVEPYVERGRHVEVQVFGDGHEGYVALGDRDCSVQRRHQKVIEEAPAPGLPPELRAAMHEAARRAAQVIDYCGAGTVEFLVACDAAGAPERFFFLEMNTRLQVEHPVTECVTGLDLVELQLAVAEGRGLGTATTVSSAGHAVEARLYAEDPAQDWRPHAGLLTRFEIPDVTVELGPLTAPGVRLDSGFRSGNEVGTHYDAMLAKVIAWAPTREAALRRLAAALRRARVHGVRTNRELLVEVLGHPDFRDARLSTAFLEDVELRARQASQAASRSTAQELALFAAAVAWTEHVSGGSPWRAGVRPGWRNVVSAPQKTAFEHEGTSVEISWVSDGDGYRRAGSDPGSDPGAAVPRARPVHRSGRGPDSGDVRVEVEHEGATHLVDVAITGDRVDVDHPGGHLALVKTARFLDPADRVAEGSLLAPMPGSVVAVHVQAGDRVSAGQPVLVLEAMKMQHTLTAPAEGTVQEIHVEAGDQVGAETVLAVLSTPPQQAEGDPS